MPYTKSLNKEVLEIWALVLSQHKKVLTALIEFDKDLAREIILIEERVNSCEQFIESDSEYYFSLNASQPINISFAMFALKITRQVEIIGDLANKMANDILNANHPYPDQLLTDSNIDEIFRSNNKILELAMQAFEETDLTLAQVVLSRIEICREMIADSNRQLANYLTNYPDHLTHGLSLFSVLESIKRTLEVSKSLLEGIMNFNLLVTVQI